MAPSKKPKKTQSLPNPNTVRLLRAVKKARSSKSQSVKSQSLSPSPSSSSPESVKKKPISTNLQKVLSKKRKQVDPVTPPKEEEGLKLLTRGCVTMNRIVKRKIRGIKLMVPFNDKGEPLGQEGSEMQSYIGVLARTKSPIWHDSWKDVSKETKNKIWECVQMAYIVPPTAKKMVLKSACSKWREFKSRLTKDYVLPFKDNYREMLEHPPADYSFIEKAHWDLFVTDRLSKEFQAIHEASQERRKKNLYPHIMSRRGYANLEHDLSQKNPNLKIDRSLSWVHGRMDKNGQFKSEAVRLKAKEIEEMRILVAEGKVVEEGFDDILTKVLGNPEHQGRVRGQGSHVKQSVYFDLPNTRKRRSMDERIREGIEKAMAERDAYWASEIEKLKAQNSSKSAGNGSSPIIDSQGASCSDSMGGQAIKEDAVRKRLNLESEIDPIEEKTTEEFVDVGEQKFVDVGKHEEIVDVDKCEEVVDVGKHEEIVDVDKCEEVVDDKNKSEEVKAAISGPTERKLALGSLSNIVAFAIVDEVATVEGCEQILHGLLLGEDNARVTITRPIQPAVEIPFPIQDEIVTVGQALGTYIAWPREFILEETISPMKCKAKRRKKIALKKSKNVAQVVDEPDCEFVLEMDDNFPAPLKRLWIWAKDAMCDGRTVCFSLCEEAFGFTAKQYVYLQDIHNLCSRGEISGSIICMFINHLQEYLKKHKMTDMISFVDPGKIGIIGCGNVGLRSQALAHRFRDSFKGQYFLLPYNDVNHWVLTVVNPQAGLVYHMDPLKRRIATGEWVEVVDNGIKLYCDQMKKVGKKKIVWENMGGIPVQSGVKDCGLFTMRYMKEICENKELDFHAKWKRRSNLVYTEDDINEVRIALAKFIMKHRAR